MRPIIEIHSISKKFIINKHKLPYLSLRDSISGIFNREKNKSDFWALKDISLNIMPGETLGIIGKNGAGKSTLLKILSKITPPTSGKIIGRGRIASLLEVGTGFHPELNGRENIFMNGSILGMRRTEIFKNFDAIVDFAGVEKFIYTPIKHYSSGMQLRLAFAVAAFLENEILIIDEVLAVGDAEFQKKCMIKMNDVSKTGRTILFVSHNMGAIKVLCEKTLYLENSMVKTIGVTEDVIHDYLKTDNASFKYNRKKEESIQITDCEVEILNEKIALKLVVYSDESLRCSVDFRFKDFYKIPVAFASVGANNNMNTIVLYKGENTFMFLFPLDYLANGTYFLSIDLTQPNITYFERAEDIIQFEVNVPPFNGEIRRLEQKWNYGSMQIPIYIK